LHAGEAEITIMSQAFSYCRGAIIP
jgi:hypothetical protein